jgi:hypothetical protein
VSLRQECDGCKQVADRANADQVVARWYDITLPATDEAVEKEPRYPTREDVQGCCKECAIKVIQES